jgi:transposase
MNVTTVGIDSAKNTFSLHGVDSRGKMVFRKALARAKLMPFLAEQLPCLIGIEACSGAHYWGRELTKHGHRVGRPAVVSTLQYRLLL